MIPEEEKQDIQLHFRVVRREKEIIDQKMAQMDTMRLGVYLRKIAIDMYVAKLVLPVVSKFVSLLRYAGINLNHLTKVAHTTGCIYASDYLSLDLKFSQLVDLTVNILNHLSDI